MTATTTGERDGILSEPRLLLAVPMPPVPPQPEPAKADAPRKGSKAWAIQEACRIVGIAFHGIAEYDEASDCFCSESPHQDYRNDGKALAFVEAAVKEKLARENAPAPPAEAPPERDALGRLCVDGLPHSWATDPSGARFCGVCQHPPAEAKGEMSREELEGTLWLLSDEKGRDGTGAREVRTILAAFDSLRTRARAAEYKAEALERVIREAEEARRMIAGVQPDDRAALAVNILRAWPRAEIETFARHLLGDREQESLLLGQLQTQLEIVTRERDEAREQLAKEREGGA